MTMNIFNTVVNLLKTGQPLALITLTGRVGSAPRSVGTRMIVQSTGNPIGTIGGGDVEAEVIHAAAKALCSHQMVLKRFSLQETDEKSPDMICGGDIEILIQVVSPFDLPFFQTVTSMIRSSQRAWLITRFQDSECLQPLVFQSLIQPGGLKALLRLHDHSSQNVDVDDPFILEDFDTPRDYQRLITRL